jgi:hypothetical protein
MDRRPRIRRTAPPVAAMVTTRNSRRLTASSHSATSTSSYKRRSSIDSNKSSSISSNKSSSISSNKISRDGSPERPAPLPARIDRLIESGPELSSRVVVEQVDEKKNDEKSALETIRSAVKLRLGPPTNSSTAHTRNMVQALGRLKHPAEVSAALKLISSAAPRILGDAQDTIRMIHVGRVPSKNIVPLSLYLLSELSDLATVFAGVKELKHVYERVCQLIVVIRETCLI